MAKQIIINKLLKIQKKKVFYIFRYNFSMLFLSNIEIERNNSHPLMISLPAINRFSLFTCFYNFTILLHHCILDFFHSFSAKLTRKDIQHRYRSIPISIDIELGCQIVSLSSDTANYGSMVLLEFYEHFS